MKKTGIVLLFVSLFILIAGVIVSQFSSNKEKPPIEKEAKKEICDYELCNVEKTLTEAKKYQDYELTKIKLSVSDQLIKFNCTITNMNSKIIEPTEITITFLSNTKKKIETMKIKIPELKGKESYVLEEFTKNEKTIDAFYLQLS